MAIPQNGNVPAPLVSVLIVTWNSAGVIGDCLDSIREKAGEVPWEAILVDNDSPDQTVSLVERDYPWVRLIQSGRNLGFARAMNLAASQAQGEYLFLLNPDARLENEALGLLAGFLKNDPQAGAASPDILDSSGKRALAALQEPPTLVSQFLRQFGLAKILRLEKGRLGQDPKQGRRLSGSALMIPRQVWQQVGGLNQELPLYFEDLDISVRIRRAGLSLWRVPEARVTHAGELSAEASPQRRMLLAMENGQAPWMYYRLYHCRNSAQAFSVIIFCGSLFRLILMWTLGLGVFLAGSRGGNFRKRVLRDSSALLRWAWGSKKGFLIKVQEYFYGVAQEESEPKSGAGDGAEQGPSGPDPKTPETVRS